MKPKRPSANPTTRFVPTARCGVKPTARRSAGTRNVPRMTPRAPPITPITRPKSTAAPTRGSAPNRTKEKTEPVPGDPPRHTAEQKRLGDEVPGEPADDRADDRGWSHP